MPLRGRAFMAMWHGVVSGSEVELTRWHTTEHMPDRVSLPGFNCGRRYLNPTHATQPFFTMYEGQTIESFQSPEYLARLAMPTEATARAMTLFVGFERCVCEVLSSVGVGLGGAMATFRLSVTADGAAVLRATADDRAAQLVAVDHVVGAHIGWAHVELMRVPVQRPEGHDFNAVVLVEGTALSQLESALPTIARQLSQTPGVRVQGAAAYQLAYLLASTDMTSSTES